MKRTEKTLRLAAVPLLAFGLLAAAPGDARAARSLDEYRHFRALSVDLLGRMPTLDEVEAFEKQGFDLDTWIDKHVAGSAYAERLVRVYMDLLRLDPGPAVNIQPDATTLYRKVVIGPDGRDVFVFYRKGQRRLRDETDGDFCLGPTDLSKDPPKDAKHPKTQAAPAGSVAMALNAMTPGALGPGAAPMASGSASGKAAPPPPPMGPMPPQKMFVSQKALDENTVTVRPWWLYRDYDTMTPQVRYGAGWAEPDPLYKPVESLLTESDKRPTVEVRVCKEEAQTGESGHLHVTARKPGTKPVAGRLVGLPGDTGYAVAHRGESVACTNRIAFQSSPECGCGPGLERCLPSDAEMQGGAAFYFPLHSPLSVDQPIDMVRQQTGKWFALWWSQEAVHFLRSLFQEDHDFREILTSRATYVNGPLAQFYKQVSPSSCCGAEASFGMVQELEPLFNPTNVPKDLLPHDVSKWQYVKDRGPHAAGLLTMPIFLEKFASRRARGATLYTAFLCKSFVAEAVELAPSTEPNLMVRPGCSTCHATLEPLAAYFSRVEETSWTFLPAKFFPTTNATCKKNAQGKLPGQCNPFYDADFASDQGATLRGAYASATHANEEPAGAGRDIVASPEFAQCAARRVASSFLGRALTPDDAALLTDLSATFVANGYHPRALVSALVRSPAYAKANNLSSATWRGGAK